MKGVEPETITMSMTEFVGMCAKLAVAQKGFQDITVLGNCLSDPSSVGAMIQMAKETLELLQCVAREMKP
ncbi:MAG: hypothetical protein P8Y53_23035 [Pseudolabrys sp.]